MIKRYEDILKIKEMILRVADGLASPQELKIIFNTYGGLSTVQARGMVMGIEACLADLLARRGEEIDEIDEIIKHIVDLKYRIIGGPLALDIVRDQLGVLADIVGEIASKVKELEG